MQGKDVMQALVDKSGLSRWSASKAMGKAGAYLDSAIRRGSVPSVDTAAAIADVAGVDVALIDRASGDVIAVVDPPRKAAQG